MCPWEFSFQTSTLHLNHSSSSPFVFLRAITQWDLNNNCCLEFRFVCFRGCCRNVFINKLHSKELAFREDYFNLLPSRLPLIKSRKFVRLTTERFSKREFRDLDSIIYHDYSTYFTFHHSFLAFIAPFHRYLCAGGLGIFEAKDTSEASMLIHSRHPSKSESLECERRNISNYCLRTDSRQLEVEQSWSCFIEH